MPIDLDLFESCEVNINGTVYEGKAAVDAMDAYKNDARYFFDRRGVDLAVREARPYGSWTPERPEALKAAWFPYVDKEQRGWVSRIAGESAGFLIPRFAPPGIGAPAVSAEIRPLKPVRTTPWNAAKYVHCPGEGQASRLDMHPDAVSLFSDATRVFFGIEGCVKEDAMLSQGEAVFSVPACWQWRVPEMAAFADKYLAGKVVFIVPDGDWAKNWQVRSAAIQCSSYLRGFGLERVFVAAPPPELLDDGIKGVDDFLGAGYSLDDMVVIGREIPKTFEQWATKIAREGRVDGAARDAEVLQALSLSAGITEDRNGERVELDGEAYKSIKPMIGMVAAANPKKPHMEPKKIRQAIESLSKRPGLTSEKAITISGSTETEEAGEEWLLLDGVLPTTVTEDDSRGRAWGHAYPRPYDWKSRPRITIAPELRARELEPVRVGDLMADLTFESFRQFRLRDVTVERLRQLRQS